MRTTIQPHLRSQPLTLLGAAAGASAQDKVKLAIGQRGNWDTSVSEIGQRAGIFKKHGLELEIVYTQGAGETQQAVISGSVDIGIAAGVMGVLSAYSKGAPVRVIGAETTGANDLYWYVKADSPIKSLKDTDGKTLAYSTNGSSTHGIVTAFMKQYDLKAKPTAIGGPAANLTAVMSGQIDVGWAAPPFGLDQLDQKQIRIIATGNDAAAFKGQTVRLNIANANFLKDAQGRGRSLHESLPRDGQLHVHRSEGAEGLFGVAQHHRGQGQAHARRLLSALVDRAGQDRRPRYDREGRGRAEIHRQRTDQGAARRADPDSAAVMLRAYGLKEVTVRCPNSAHPRESGDPAGVQRSGCPLPRA